MFLNILSLKSFVESFLILFIYLWWRAVYGFYITNPSPD